MRSGQAFCSTPGTPFCCVSLRSAPLCSASRLWGVGNGVGHFCYVSCLRTAAEAGQRYAVSLHFTEISRKSEGFVRRRRNGRNPHFSAHVSVIPPPSLGSLHVTPRHFTTLHYTSRRSFHVMPALHAPPSLDFLRPHRGTSTEHRQQLLKSRHVPHRREDEPIPLFFR